MALTGRCCSPTVEAMNRALTDKVFFLTSVSRAPDSVGLPKF
jgi:hypothetical protein